VTPHHTTGVLATTVGGFGGLNWAILATYMAALVAVGVCFARREKCTDDFFLAGRRIPWWAAGLSIFGTQLSAITYLAMPARAYATDWSLLPLNVGILLIAPVVVFAYLPLFRRLNVTTAYEYLETRFHVSIRLFGSLSFILFQLGRMGVVILLPALALSAVTGMSVYLCILLIGVVSTLYTALGGMEAVIWTDVLQSVILLAGALAALAITIGSLDGGWREFASVGMAHHKFTLFHLHWDWTGDAVAVVILGALFTNSLIPYTTDQCVIQRYLTTPSQKQAAKAIWVNGLLAVFVGVLFLTLGTALFVFYQAHPTRLESLATTDQIFAVFIAREIPAGLAGLVIAGVFAAAMSSLDSSIHSISTAVTTDFLRRFRPNLAAGTYLAFARSLTVIFGVTGTATALVMAAAHVEHLWDLFLGILGLTGGTLAGLFLLGISTKTVRTPHAWLGVLAAVAALVYVKLATNLNGLLYGAIGVTVCFLTALAASRIRPAKSHRVAYGVPCILFPVL
jgi:SSS family transporter